MVNREDIVKSFKEGIEKTLKNVKAIKENSTGSAIRPNTIIPSEKRTELADLYKVLQNEYGDLFNVQFNQTNIVINIGCTGDPRTDVFEESQQKEPVAQDFDWATNLASMVGFFQKEGLQLDPLPEIILKKEPQTNGLLDPTGDYDPDKNLIQIYTHGRHPRDIFSTVAHELVHCDQNHKGKLQNIHTEDISKDNNLLNLEAEAYKKGRLLFRKWLGTLGCYGGK